MSPPRLEVPRVVQLADRLEQDISARGLVQGDGYLTTQDAAQLLHVSTSTANRALQLLVQRGVLLRRQRKGAEVLRPPLAPGSAGGDHGLTRVHLVAPEQPVRREGLFSDGLLLGLHAALPGVDFRRVLVDLPRVEEDLAQLLADGRAQGGAEAFVLARGNLEAQRALELSGRPTVLFGTPWPSVEGLSSLDRDQAAIGSLLTDWLLARGHRRVLVLLRARVHPGDHDLLDGVRRSLAAAGLGADALLLRGLPLDEACCAAQVRRDLAAAGDDRPGILARSEPLLRGALDGLAAAGSSPEHVALAVADLYVANEEREARLPAAYARPRLTPEQRGERLGRLLLESLSGAPVRHERLAVDLEEPGRP